MGTKKKEGTAGMMETITTGTAGANKQTSNNNNTDSNTIAVMFSQIPIQRTKQQKTKYYWSHDIDMRYSSSKGTPQYTGLQGNMCNHTGKGGNLKNCECTTFPSLVGLTVVGRMIVWLTAAPT
jgi:hypothetical protein